MTSRLEHRNSDTEDRWSSTTGWYREPVEGHAMSVSLQAFDIEQRVGQVDGRRWAASPGRSAPTRAAGSCSTASSSSTTKHSDCANSFDSGRVVVNNLHANWQLNPSLQLGLQYGARYVSSTFEGEQYAGVSDIVGFDLRRQLTRRFDLGAARRGAAFLGIGCHGLLHGLRRRHDARQERLDFAWATTSPDSATTISRPAATRRRART